MSTARHPQTDGQTERVNQCLETFLRCFVNSCPAKWYGWLPLAEFWYNTSPHSALGSTPFEVLYGHAPRHFGIINPVACASPDLPEWLQDRTQMTALIRQHLLRAGQQMKESADKHRSDRVFAEGDWVFLKLQPYVQCSVATRANQKPYVLKLQPYKVLRRVGTVAYKLQMPKDSTVHPVFHVSQLRQALPPIEQVLPHLPPAAAAAPVPEDILESRVIQRGGVDVPQVRVQWTDQPSELATWEDRQELQQHFPQAPAWGQAVTQGGENVTAQVPSKPTTAAATSGPERGQRQRRPNTRLPAHTWDTSGFVK